MARWVFQATGLTANTTYRVDSAATGDPEGQPGLLGSWIRSDGSGALPTFVAPFQTVYARVVSAAGLVSGGATTLTGVYDADEPYNPIPDGTVGTADLVDGAVTLGKLADEVTALLGGGHGDAYPASAGIRATLTRGQLSTCILALGDSTGDATDEWIYKLGGLLGGANPSYSVNYRLWGPDNTTESWGPVTQIQAGTAGGNRGVKPASGNPLYYTNASAYTGDFGYRVWCSPSDGWAPGGSAAVRNLVCRWNDSSSNRHSKFGVNEGGYLVWEWSAAGTASTGTAVSTAPVPFTGTSWGWVRVEFDVDNGSSGNTATFYTSADGWTWTQLGDPVVTAGATTLSSSTLRFQLGEYGTGGGGLGFANTFFGWVDVRNNSLSATTWQRVAASNPEGWQYTHNGTLPTITGAPVIWILNASRAGQGISWFNDSNRRVKLHADQGQQLVILSDGHNEQADVGNSWRNNYGAWLDDIRNRSKYTPIVCVLQNPGFINGGSLTLSQLAATINANRQRDVASVAAGTTGCYPLDFWPVFNAESLATDVPDNLHPAAAIQTVMAQHAYDSLFA